MIKIKKIDTPRSDWFANLVLCVAPLIFLIISHCHNYDIPQLKITGDAIKVQTIQGFMIFALICLGIFGFYRAYKKRLTAENIIILILITGIIMRTGYTAYTDAFTRYQDMGSASPNANGHWAYLYSVVHGHLPANGSGQFYHPPLYYIISSLFIRLSAAFTGGNIDDLNNYTYLAQAVSCTCSCIMLVMFRQIMNELNISDRAQLIPLMITAVYPNHCLTAGRLNNDSMAFMFMTLSLYFTLKWHHEQKIGYIIGIAVSIGCAMMSKLNGALMAFISGPVMLYHFIKTIRTKDKAKIKNIIVQFAVFAVIVFPLGMWYSIRNYILFDQPLNYVLNFGENNPLYRGKESFAARWLDINFFGWFTHPWFSTADDINVWEAFIKSAMHGEFSWTNIPWIFLTYCDYAHAALLIIALASVIFTIAKDKGLTREQKYIPLLLWVLTMGSYIKFNIDFPFSSTADFRYMLMWQLAEVFFIGYFIDYCFRNKDKKVFRYLFNVQIFVVFVFCALSITKYLL